MPKALEIDAAAKHVIDNSKKAFPRNKAHLM